jgi:hypothetical protein
VEGDGLSRLAFGGLGDARVYIDGLVDGARSAGGSFGAGLDLRDRVSAAQK